MKNAVGILGVYLSLFGALATAQGTSALTKNIVIVHGAFADGSG